MLTRRMNPKVAVSVALPAISRDLSVPLDRVDGSRSTAAAENHQNHVMPSHQAPARLSTTWKGEDDE